jgi:hypothetical protein
LQSYTNSCPINGRRTYSDADFLPDKFHPGSGYGFGSSAKFVFNQEALQKYQNAACDCPFFTFYQFQIRVFYEFVSCDCFQVSGTEVETVNTYKHVCGGGWVDITGELYANNRSVTNSRRTVFINCNNALLPYPPVPSPRPLDPTYPCVAVP